MVECVKAERLVDLFTGSDEESGDEEERKEGEGCRVENSEEGDTADEGEGGAAGTWHGEGMVGPVLMLW